MLPRISDTGLTAAQFSNFALTTNAESQITAITETADTAPVYPPASSQTASYNSLNQLTNLPGQTLTYDANGNLLSDGQRSYAWDAERRLVRITYPGQAVKQSDFSYDGRDRRTAISETPPTGGGTAVTTQYLWCGGDICQARNVGNTVIRSYHDDGEYLPGTPATTLFYGTDQVGSVRRVFTSTTVAPAFAYDPYGVPLQGTAPATDYGYAGMFRHGPSGLNLTRYRAYDPVAGRWLSRDPLGEGTDPAGNLYAYVGGEPISRIDPTGEMSQMLPAGAGAGAGQVGMTFQFAGLQVVIVREGRWVGSALQCRLVWLGPQIKPLPTLLGASTSLPMSPNMSVIPSAGKTSEQNCAILRDNIINQTCKSIRDIRARAACIAAAWVTYYVCLAG